VYRGMGSLEAMQANQASRERYGQANVSQDKLVPEGVKSWLNFKGDVGPVVRQLLGGLQAGMGYVGAKDIEALRKKADFHRISVAGLKESFPHNLDVVDKEGNYLNR